MINSDDYPYVLGRVPELSAKYEALSPSGKRSDSVFTYGTPPPPQRSESVPVSLSDYRVLEGSYSFQEREETEVTYTEPDAEPEYQDIELNTVADWLNVLGLACYTDVFEFNGWENLMVLQEMRMSDLNNMGIKSPNDRALIIAAIQDLKQC